jgi:hypothetical protein
MTGDHRRDAASLAPSGAPGVGGAVRSKLVWPLAGLACLIVLGAISAFWIWEGKNFGISVGLPVGATLLAPILAWAIDADPHAAQSTSEQFQHAKRVLATRTLREWRGVGSPAGPSGYWRPSSQILSTRWAECTIGGVASVAGNAALMDGPDNAASLAVRVLREEPTRLVILGEAGSGKTTLARSLMIEILKASTPADPVPVFLPLASWNPGRYRLNDWIVRQIGQEAPELRDASNYGPTAIADLVGLGVILPILDGLDSVPHAFRQAMLNSDDFRYQDRLVLTSRSREFLEASEGVVSADTAIFMPGRVMPGDAITYLCSATEDPQRWQAVFDSISSKPDGTLATALSDPRIVYLARAVYQCATSQPGEMILAAKEHSGPSIEQFLLTRLIRALWTAGNTWELTTPWSPDRAVGWLRYVRDNVCNPDNGEISWWSVFNATPRLYRYQALPRALLAALPVIAAIALYNDDFYGVMTGIAYGWIIASSCVFLSPVRTLREPAPRPRTPWQLVKQAWRRSRRIAAAGFSTFCGFGLIIGVRTVHMHGSHLGIRTGLSDGIVAALAVVVGALIAGLPTRPHARPSRIGGGTGYETAESSDLDGNSVARSIAGALALGTGFGLLVGLLVVVRHQFANGPTLRQALLFGLIIGINFAAGAWLVRWTRIRLASSNISDPQSGYRAERRFTLLASAILCVTFASAFGLDANLQWSLTGAITNGLGGVVVGSLVSDWPLYVIAVSLLALRRKLPLRLMKFFGLGQDRTVLRSAQQSYQFREDPRLTLQPAGLTRHEQIAWSSTADARAPAREAGATAAVSQVSQIAYADISPNTSPE